MKLYFDEQSGLLIRLVRYTSSPLGRVPTQIDYGDYREVDGVKIPYRRTIAQFDGASNIQMEEVKQNFPIDQQKFAKPKSSMAKGNMARPDGSW